MSKTSMCEAVTQTYAICPHCNKRTDSTVDHLLQEVKSGKHDVYTAGPWTCNHCRHRYRIHVNKDLFITTSRDKNNGLYLPIWVLLCHNETNDPKNNLYLLVNGGLHAKKDEPLDFTSVVSYYNSHTCPINYLNGKPIIGSDPDPHGIFKFVAARLAMKVNEFVEFHQGGLSPSLLNDLDAYVNIRDFHSSPVPLIFEMFGIRNPDVIYACPDVSDEIEPWLHKTTNSLTYKPEELNLDSSNYIYTTPIQ